MSKSRGTFIMARRYLELLPAEPLRYYFAAKLGADVDDIDLTLDDFVARLNSDLVGKLVNIASRCAGFIERGGGQLAGKLPDQALYREFARPRPRIARLSRRATTPPRCARSCCSPIAPTSMSTMHKPWALAKDPARADEVLAVATQGINLFRALMLALAPVLPTMAARPAASSVRRSTAGRGRDAAARHARSGVRAARDPSRSRRSSPAGRRTSRRQRRDAPPQARRRPDQAQPKRDAAADA